MTRTREGDLRLERLMASQFVSTWKTLRRLGLSPADADDAAQAAFVILSRKIATISPGREGTFLLRTAIRVASNVRRSSRFAREVFTGADEEIVSVQLGPDEQLERQRMRRLLDDILEQMPFELRAVFVLSEMDQMTMATIASTLELPPGTVASRLRRAREIFSATARRVHLGERQ